MEYVNEGIANVTTAGDQILPANGSRLHLVISSSGNVPICFTTSVPSTGSSRGMFVSSTIPLIVGRRDIGIAITYPVYLSSNVLSAVYFLEVYDPQRPYQMEGVATPTAEDIAAYGDPHDSVPGIDIPDPLAALVSQLMAMRSKRRG